MDPLISPPSYIFLLLRIGYIYSNDDIIINWWNLLKLDRDKVWQSGIVDFRQKAYGNIVNNRWMWWNSDMGLEACRKYHKDLVRLSKSQPKIYKRLLENYMSNGEGTARCAKGWTDAFYVPGKYSEFYIKLSNIAYKNKLFLELLATILFVH